MATAPDGITFDKTAYAPGDKVTCTVVDSKRKKTFNVDWKTIFADLTAAFTVAVTGKLSDDGAHTWVVVSDDGVTAVLTTTA